MKTLLLLAVLTFGVVIQIQAQRSGTFRRPSDSQRMDFDCFKRDGGKCWKKEGCQIIQKSLSRLNEEGNLETIKDDIQGCADNANEFQYQSRDMRWGKTPLEMNTKKCVCFSNLCNKDFETCVATAKLETLFKQQSEEKKNPIEETEQETKHANSVNINKLEGNIYITEGKVNITRSRGQSTDIKRIPENDKQVDAEEPESE